MVDKTLTAKALAAYTQHASFKGHKAALTAAIEATGLAERVAELEAEVKRLTGVASWHKATADYALDEEIPDVMADLAELRAAVRKAWDRDKNFYVKISPAMREAVALLPEEA